MTRLRRLRRKWQVWRILHYKWSLIWWSRSWRWKLVRHGLLPLPMMDEGSPPLTLRDLRLLRRPDTSEWERRHEINDAWWEAHRLEYELRAGKMNCQ